MALVCRDMLPAALRCMYSHLVIGVPSWSTGCRWLWRLALALESNHHLAAICTSVKILVPSQIDTHGSVQPLLQALACIRPVQVYLQLSPVPDPRITSVLDISRLAKLAMNSSSSLSLLTVRQAELLASCSRAVVRGCQSCHSCCPTARLPSWLFLLRPSSNG